MVMQTIETVDLSSMHETFQQDGFVIARQAFTSNLMNGLVDSLYASLANKRNDCEGLSIDELMMKREAEDHGLVYNAATSLGSSAATYRMLGGSRILEIVTAVLGIKPADLHVMPLYLLVQLPQDGRFDYNWHQDAPYYPWCRELASLWFPVTHRTSLENGTMAVVPGSHKNGLRNAETYFRNGSFRQIETIVEESEATNSVPLELEVGDCLISSGNLVHASIPNRGRVPRVNGILRLVNMAAQQEYRRDLFFCAAPKKAASSGSDTAVASAKN